MGRMLLVWRLVAGDLKRRKLQALLLVLLVVTTTATLTLALTLRHSSQNPFERTQAATKGPDFVAENGPAPGSTSAPSTSQFTPLLHAAGVAATAGPFPVAFTRLTAKGIDVPVDAEGRDAGPSDVDHPLLTAGHWITSGGAVIEQGFAKALGLHVGEEISVGGHRLQVVGIALTTAQPFYPASTPGLIWVTRQDAVALATADEPLGYVLDIKMAPDAPLHSLDAPSKAFATAGAPASVQPASAIQAADYRVIALDQKVLLLATTLLAILAVSSIAVLVGGRMAEQTRRVGLLKAAGGSPGFVGAVLLTENVILALVAAAVGLVTGALIAPRLASPGDGLLGGAHAPSPTSSTAAFVISIALLVAAGSTLVPAIRAARISTLHALHNPATSPRRHQLLVSVSTHLPVPLLLALRLAARRGRRTLLTACSLTITVMMVVAALTVQQQVTNHQNHAAASFVSNSAVYESANQVLIAVSAALACLAAICTVFTAWATVIDTRIATALARAFGATPRQLTAGTTAAQMLPAFVAACLGIPLGLLLYRVVGGNLSTARPPIWSLLAVIPATLIGVALATGLPARIGAHQSVAEVLRGE